MNSPANASDDKLTEAGGPPEQENEPQSSDEIIEENSVQQPGGNWLSTGLEPLDKQLGGGIPPGRLVAFIAPPDTQSELLLKHLLTQRKSLYLSTLRPKWEVEEEIADHLQRTKGPKPIDVNEVSSEALLANPMDYLSKLEPNSNLIVDAVNELERQNGVPYIKFLNTAKKRLWESGSVGVFYGIEEKQNNPQARSITLRRADLIWKLRISVEANSIEHQLVISKFRGGGALTEPIKLVLTDNIEVDNTRSLS